MGNQENLNDDEDICVTLDMEDGTAVECEILTIFEVNDQEYIALLPKEEEESDDDESTVYIYRYSEDAEGNPTLENIDNDEEYEAVEERFDELLDEAEFEEI